MKLLTYDPGTGPRCGVMQDDAVVDVAALIGVGQPLPDVRALLELGDSAVDRVGDALASNVAAPRVALADVRLRAPVLQPPTVRDYIVYEEHATAQGTREIDPVWYRMPVFYFSNPLVIYGPDEEVPYPSASDQLDYELEIGCIIGRAGTNVPASEALQYIAGFCIFNDWSARDLQFDEMTFGLGPAKGKDSASSIGPWLVTTDELEPYIRDGRLDVACHVRVNGDDWLRNGEAVNAYYGWGEIIERASKDSRIAPGDVIGSGTVGGGSIRESIRKGYENARWLEPGDVVEMEVERIGVLRNGLGAKESVDPELPLPSQQPHRHPGAWFGAGLPLPQNPLTGRHGTEKNKGNLHGCPYHLGAAVGQRVGRPSATIGYAGQAASTVDKNRRTRLVYFSGSSEWGRTSAHWQLGTSRWTISATRRG